MDWMAILQRQRSVLLRLVGVASAHDKNLFARASWCFAHGGAVQNASSRKTLEARYVQAAVGHTSCDDNCPAFYLRTVRKGRDDPHPVCAQ